MENTWSEPTGLVFSITKDGKLNYGPAFTGDDHSREFLTKLSQGIAAQNREEKSECQTGETVYCLRC